MLPETDCAGITLHLIISSKKLCYARQSFIIQHK
jgi:hypothetical protein